MIYSIEFTGKGKDDYLMKRNLVPELREGKTMEEWNKSKKGRYSKSKDFDKFFKMVDKGLSNDRANKCLVNKKFTFERDRINIIFGPNASGKSTIVKTIAAYGLCGTNMQDDGLTNYQKFHPADYPLSSKNIKQDLLDLIYKKAGNEAIIDWDGSLIYYHNYFNRIQSGTIDDFEGTIVGGFGEALNYWKDKYTLSDGKRTLFIFSKLFNIANSHYKFSDLKKDCEDKANYVNDIWIDVFKNQLNYLSKFQNNNEDHITFLFDEIDKSLDINNVERIFSEFIPELHKINNDQIIVISHSPLVLNKNICSPEKYNLISMDDDYTNYVKKVFNFN